MSKAVYVPVAPLPATNDGFTATKKLSLIDHVKADLLNGAYAELTPLLNATQNKDAVNGSVRMDRAMAALAYKNIAKKAGNEWVAKHDLTQIDRALLYATRGIKDRDGHRIDRKSRRILALEHRHHRFDQEHAGPEPASE